MSNRFVAYWGVSGVALGIIILLLAEGFRAHSTVSKPLLSVSFEHQSHTQTQCAECHHNFIDSSGGGTCYNCHKHTPDIAADIERTFHEFCFSCHIAKQREGEDAGPMRECSRCH